MSHCWATILVNVILLSMIQITWTLLSVALPSAILLKVVAPKLWSNSIDYPWLRLIIGFEFDDEIFISETGDASATATLSTSKVDVMNIDGKVAPSQIEVKVLNRFRLLASTDIRKIFLKILLRLFLSEQFWTGDRGFLPSLSDPMAS